MAVVALTSASGSPGVTTTALGLALLWPRPVLLVEADPTGGSAILAGYFRGSREYDAGLLELALSPADITDSLRDVVRPIDGTTVSLVVGVRSHAQAAGLRELWSPLTDALSALDDTGQDVIVDAGRLGLVGAPEALVADADLTLLLTRSSLPAIAASRSWTDAGGKSHQWRNGAVIIIGEGQPYQSHEIGRALKLPVLSTVADDPTAASVFSRGQPPERGFQSSPLVRSLHATVASIQAQLARSEAALMAETLP